MLLQWLLAALHILALGIGAGAIWARTVALRSEPIDRAALTRIFKADVFWGVAALLWLATGLLRAFAGFEKGTDYYIHNHLFLTKMVLFLVVVAMETKVAIALGRWRREARQGGAVDTSLAPKLARTSVAEAHLLVVMILVATAMARGIG